MGREIKFRGKRLDIGEWVVGNYYEKAAPLQCIGSQEQGTSFIVLAGFADWNMPRPMYEVEVDPKTVGQFTGLYDMHKKEIYDKDLCKCGSKILQVFWNSLGSGGWWFAEIKDGFREHAKQVNLDELEVVGNTFEDSHLFGVKQ